MIKNHPPTKKQVNAALKFYAVMAKKPSACFADPIRNSADTKINLKPDAKTAKNE